MKVFLLLSIGFSITHAVVYLHIFEWFRKFVSGVDDRQFHKLIAKIHPGFRIGFLGRVVRCHSCFGFWVGVFLYSFAWNSILEEMILVGKPAEVIGWGFLQLGFNSLAWLVLYRLGAEDM